MEVTGSFGLRLPRLGNHIGGYLPVSNVSTSLESRHRISQRSLREGTEGEGLRLLWG